MKRTAQLGLAALALAIATQQAAATSLDFCCACVPDLPANGPAGLAAPAPAFFCAEALAGGEPSLQQRCADLDQGGGLVCFANIPGPSCREQLLEEGIACPTAGAPVVAPLGLAALAALLSGLGVAALRRRTLRRARVSRRD